MFNIDIFDSISKVLNLKTPPYSISISFYGTYLMSFPFSLEH